MGVNALVDVMLSETRDIATADKFFRSAKAVTGVTPTRVNTDGHDSYPRAIRLVRMSATGTASQYLNNRIAQGHRGIKSRYGQMGGFGAVQSAARFCRFHDELSNLLHANYRGRETSRRASPLLPASKPHRPPRGGLVMNSQWKKS